LYSQIIDYVKRYFNNADNPRSKYDSRYPFRNNFEHCMRVYHWALRINSAERGDRDVIAIASLFHDIGKTVNLDYSHADIGADICNAYLTTICYPSEKRVKIVQAIRLHPYKDNPSLSLTLEEKILMDADLLDEVGALTAVWDSMATAMEDMPDYLKVYKRSSRFYSKVARKKESIKTDTGRLFYEQRLDVLSGFIENLGFELGVERDR
jgi:uncharacterized protein